MWIICLILSLAVLIICGLTAAAFAKKPQMKANRILTPFNVLFAGVIASVLIIMFPVYYAVCRGEQLQLLKALLFTVHGTIQIFTVDSDISLIPDYINSSVGRVAAVYSGYVSLLYVAAPLFTVGFLVSFFKNASAYIRFFLKRKKEVYVFSELNEKSLALASDIKHNHPDAAVVFTDVFENNEEKSYELVTEAEKIGGICFKKDILAVRLKIHSASKPMYLFVIGEDESENIVQAVKLIRVHGDIPDSNLYIFTTNIESELLLSHKAEIPMKVRRINEVRSLITRTLYEDGEDLFKNALPAADGRKKIHAVIAGLGGYGTEMLKALTWYCQMDGYTIEIDAFDRDELAEERFKALCPELMSPVYNGVSVPGETEYTIRIHSGVDVETGVFSESISKMKDVTYAFAALGSDENNVKSAVNLRMLFERSGIKPVIQLVVNNSDEKSALSGITNYRGQRYNIDCIGDLDSSFSEKVILNSDLEDFALKQHLKWGSEEEFWQYEYNYRSSIASAIHIKARISCNIPGAAKSEDQLTEEERSVIERLEHRRWNAYMRSEGYVYSGSPEKSSRNDLAKMHHDLVDFSSLSEDEKRKDSRVGTV